MATTAATTTTTAATTTITTTTTITIGDATDSSFVATAADPAAMRVRSGPDSVDLSEMGLHPV